MKSHYRNKIDFMSISYTNGGNFQITQILFATLLVIMRQPWAILWAYNEYVGEDSERERDRERMQAKKVHHVLWASLLSQGGSNFKQHAVPCTFLLLYIFGKILLFNFYLKRLNVDIILDLCLTRGVCLIFSLSLIIILSIYT